MRANRVFAVELSTLCLYSLVGRLNSSFALLSFRRSLHSGRCAVAAASASLRAPLRAQSAVSPQEALGARSASVSSYHTSSPTSIKSFFQRMGADMSAHSTVTTPPAPSGGYPEGVSVPASEEQWRQRLTPMEYRVLREQATEPPKFSERTPGELENELLAKEGSKYPQAGRFDCKGCGAPLYPASTKFDSGCGWPAFYDCIPGAVTELPDADGYRIEIRCSTCGSHLGHTFKGEGFKTPTNERHCVNGVCLKYVK